MTEEVLPDAAAVARRAAEWIAGEARAAVEARGRFLVATSGGTTPWRMLRELAREEVPWSRVHLFQVDERIRPDGDPERNLTHLRESLLAELPSGVGGLHPMPVEETDAAIAAAAYEETLRSVAGNPPVLDVVHLGLGEDGHTASLVPGDLALEVTDADVAATAPYRGTRRLTFTYPVLNRARRLLWVVTGAGKGPALSRLRLGDPGIPAGRVDAAHARILCDADADRASRDLARP